MRSLSALLLFFLLAGMATAEEITQEPIGNLAQVMRAILFPNSNILFKTQTDDVETIGARTEADRFSGIYKGWDMVEQAAIALAEVEKLIMVPGRLCENGKPVPIDQADFAKWAKQLTEAGKLTLAAARSRDQEKVSDLTNNLTLACDDCHEKYRRYEDRCRQ